MEAVDHQVGSAKVPDNRRRIGRAHIGGHRFNACSGQSQAAKKGFKMFSPRPFAM
jgi:hypothetical protein